MDKTIAVDAQSLIDAQDSPFVLIDRDYNIVAANRAYQQAYGMAEQQIVGHKCHQLSHHSAIPCHENGEDCPHRHVFTTQETHQVLHVHYDANGRAEHVRIKGAPVFGADGAFYLGETIIPLAKVDAKGRQRQPLAGRSRAFLSCMEVLTRAGDSDAPLMLCGESGVGKDLAAEYVHHHSARSDKGFVMVDCSAVAESVFESELFGHERGAFTGCIGRRRGLFEQAEGGTLFFNEIGDLPQSLQGRLLQAMETGRFRRVGGRELLSANVRIICATGKNLRQKVASRQFRADLYYRIAGIICEIPPLRQRRSDIPELANSLLRRMATSNTPAYRLTDEAMEKLLRHDYPGNVRELGHILQRGASLSTNGIITAREIHMETTPSATSIDALLDLADGSGTEPSIKRLESTYMAELLAEHNGKRATVARILGISERTLYRKLKQYGLESVGRSS